MGLDIGFYRDGEEVFSLRNHDEFFEALAEGSGGDVYEGYSDFYVTPVSYTHLTLPTKA